MTGSEIRRVRTLLGLGVPQFAQLLGVNVATAYRWETNVGTIPLDPLHAALLARLQQSVDVRPAQTDRVEWGKKLLTGVLIGGTLAGLAVLLAELIPASASAAAPAASRRRRQRR